MEISRNFLDKARENAKAAELCAAQALYNACANRVYYAALHTAIAALAQRGIRSEKIAAWRELHRARLLVQLIVQANNYAENGTRYSRCERNWNR